MRLGTGKILAPRPIKKVIMVAMGITAGAYIARRFGDRYAGDTPIWTINNGCSALRADLCFDMHTKSCLLGADTYTDWRHDKTGEFRKRFDAGELLELTAEYKKTGIDVVTLDGHDDTYEYPMQEVIDAFQTDYFTVGAAYMIAYAMLCGVEEMELAGFDFVYGDHKLEEGRACFEYWLGRAWERGIKFILPSFTSTLARDEISKKGLYGYGSDQPQFENIDGKMRLIGYGRGPASPAG